MESLEEKPKIYLLGNNIAVKFGKICFETRSQFPDDKRYWVLDDEKWANYESNGKPYEPGQKDWEKIDYVLKKLNGPVRKAPFSQNKTSSVKKIRIFVHNYDEQESRRLPDIILTDEEVTNINVYLPPPIKVKEEVKPKNCFWKNLFN